MSHATKKIPPRNYSQRPRIRICPSVDADGNCCEVAPATPAAVVDESGATKSVAITMERPLALYLNKHELLTLMTLGQMPAELAVGWLRNQQVISELAMVEEVVVDWQTAVVAVYTRDTAAADAAVQNYANEQRTLTSGCGQGTMFNRVIESVQQTKLQRTTPMTAADLFAMLQTYRELETVYKISGAVHGCALFARSARRPPRLLCHTEDIGRHNAVDAIAGWMWLNDTAGADKIFYTTGRLTSEMVIKCAQMQIPFLVSRSGVTRMGYEIANAVGLTLIGRAVNRRYLIFSGADFFVH